MLTEGKEIKSLAEKKRDVPLLAVGGGSGEFTAGTFGQVATNVKAVHLDGIGHYVAMEAPDQLAEELVSFYREIDKS
jgi:pimeloyl-ACP methyl ester carboxylesterase